MTDTMELPLPPACAEIIGSPALTVIATEKTKHGLPKLDGEDSDSRQGVFVTAERNLANTTKINSDYGNSPEPEMSRRPGLVPKVPRR